MSFAALKKHQATDRLVLRLACPCFLENLADILVSFLDAAMIGVLGPAATAAVMKVLLMHFMTI